MFRIFTSNGTKIERVTPYKAMKICMHEQILSKETKTKNLFIL